MPVGKKNPYFSNMTIASKTQKRKACPLRKESNFKVLYNAMSFQVLVKKSHMLLKK